jgi:protein SCO1
MPPGRITRHGRKNRPALAIGAAASLLLVGLAIALVAPDGAPPSTAIGGPFSLLAGDGRTITDQSFPGKFQLIYFGYSSCADICPATLNNVAAALDQLGGKAEQVQPLFITLDPAHDTQSVLRRYASAFTPRLIGLTGSPADLRRVAEAFRVFSTPGKSGALDHSSVLYLMGPDGHFLAPIRADASGAAMARDIRRWVA